MMATTPRRNGNTADAAMSASRSLDSVGRLTTIHLPPGRRIVVALPDEAARLRDRYAADSGSSAVQIEVVVHGSEEHVDGLRALRGVHEARRARLLGRGRDTGAEDDGEKDEIVAWVTDGGGEGGAGKNRHEELFAAWDRVRDDLEVVDRQLALLVDDREGREALNANFERFGYASVLRTYGPARTPSSLSFGKEGDGEGTLAGFEDRGGGGEDDDDGRTSTWESSKRSGTTVKLWQRPVIKQYFHRGLLWRSSEETRVTSIELFFDLLYVGILAFNGDRASEEANGLELHRFIITFVMSWKIWADLQQGISWFQSDDVLQRLQILFIIACLLGFTTNMQQTFHEGEDTYSQLVAFYIAARIFTALYYVLTAMLLPLVKWFLMLQTVSILIPAALWIASTHVTLWNRLALVFVALVMDLLAPAAVTLSSRYLRTHSSSLGKWVERAFEFHPAINIEHKVERTNAFVSLVFGYGIVGLMFQNAGYGITQPFLWKAIMGLVQAFVFNWIYFDVDGANIYVHAIRRRVHTALIWQMAHLPFICAYVLSVAALSKMVIASEYGFHATGEEQGSEGQEKGPGADTLTTTYFNRSEPEVSLGLRLYYCVGLGIALLGMTAISLTHKHRVPINCHILKRWRMANRILVAIIMCCLPAVSPARLDSVRLIALTMGLMVWTLAVEIWGIACPEDQMLRKGGCGGGKKSCTYNARCSKRKLKKVLEEEGNGVGAGRDRDGDEGGKSDVEKGTARKVEILALGNGQKTAVDI